MDLFVDVVALMSLPGVVCVVVGQGVIAALMPLCLVVGMLDPPS